MNLTAPLPVHDRVIVRRLTSPEAVGSIYVPERARDKLSRGVVLAVGPGRWENGARAPMSVSPRDVIIFGKYAGNEVPTYNPDGDLLSIADADVIAIELSHRDHPCGDDEIVVTYNNGAQRIEPARLVMQVTPA